MTPRVAIMGSRGYPSMYGGFETFVRHLAPHLRDLGWQVTVYGRDQAALRPTAQQVDGITTVSTWGVDKKSTSTLTFGASAGAHAARQRFDSALVLNVANGFFLPLLKRAGVPTAVNVDGIEWERAKWSSLGRRVFLHGARMTARYADEIVVDSRGIGDVWRQTFQRESTFIPYGAEVVVSGGSSRVEALGLKPESYLLVVARLVPENNVELLLDALELLDDPPPVVVVGSANFKSELEERLAALASRRSDFWWLGHVDDQKLLTELWVNCRMYFHGHSVGGTNPALLQALGAGAPTLALDTVFNREVIGFDDQVVPHDARVLAGEITTLLASPQRRDELRERGRKTIATRYQWSSVCDDYAATLERLAGQPS